MTNDLTSQPHQFTPWTSPYSGSHKPACLRCPWPEESSIHKLDEDAGTDLAASDGGDVGS